MKKERKRPVSAGCRRKLHVRECERLWDVVTLEMSNCARLL